MTMALNLDAVQILEEKLDRLEEILQENKELFNKENMYEFSSERESFRRKIEQSQQKCRMLQIGIIGAVKAGKSSFLNALLFEGEEILPKSATPMTAALTKISYSEEEGTHAVIHFYSQNDWNQIEVLSAEYDEGLEKAYAAYEDWFQKACAEIDRYNASQRDIMTEKPKEKPPHLSKEEYETRKYRRTVNENLSAAKELTTMAESADILSKLGTSENVSGSLEDYIGAKGTYTPIVNYVELQIHDERLKDFIIVDTPGLNDPIVSRGNITKKFLAECDVALLLSPTGQFMDVNTMNLMVNSLPSAGVNELIVIGSKLDSGLLDYSKSTNVRSAYSESLKSYRRQFERNRESLRSTNPIAAKKLEKVEVTFISSLFYSVSCKRKHNIVLNPEEEHILQQFQKRFTDFEEKQIGAMTGIKEVKKLLNQVITRKEEIINSKNDTLLHNSRHNIFTVLNAIETDAVSAKDKLENSEENEVRMHYDSLIDLFRRSRKKLASIFNIAASEAEKSCFDIAAQLQKEIQNCPKITTITETHTEEKERRTGFLKLRTEYYTVDVTIKKAEASQVEKNIHTYIGKCREIINEGFEYLVDKEQLSNRVKSVVIQAMHSAGGDYTEDDVLLPLEDTLAKIKIPKMDISEHEYIDMVKSAFREGVALNEKIHKLSALQVEIFSKILEDTRKELDKYMTEIRKVLQKQSDSFTDAIMKKLQNEQERIEKQMQEREKYIAQYKEFLKLLSEYRQMLNQ